MLQRKLSKIEQQNLKRQITLRATQSLESVTFKSILRGEYDVLLLSFEEERYNRVALTIIDGLLSVYNLNPSDWRDYGQNDSFEPGHQTSDSPSIRHYQSTLVNYLLLAAVLPERLSLECWIKVRYLCKAMLYDLWSLDDISANIIYLCNELSNLSASQSQPALGVEALLRQILSAPLLLEEEVTMLAFYLMGHDIAYWKTHLGQLIDAVDKSSDNGTLNLYHLFETIISRALPPRCQKNSSCTCLREDSFLTVLLSLIFTGRPYSHRAKHTDSLIPTYALARRIAKQIHSHIFLNCSSLALHLLHHLDVTMKELGHLEMGHEPKHGNQIVLTLILLRVYLPQLLKQKPDYLLATKYLIHCTNNSTTTLLNLRESLLTQKLYEHLVELGLLFTHPLNRQKHQL